ncbi:3-hydroxyacyl-CoA dehydrogenase [Massilia sp. WF1]|uniref:3-hydroxyacyl-CoA dehydrogenase PaaH n=1 Tax=unclassified Massilia TaxID=2609279 RepID=UPI00064A90DD|nr:MULTISPECIES: 3-hydroxyacyl-CoA dehydrogenase PaaH [unclassified Massilia]ALK98931.1 3-hydroxyacyl-CoA dehydrogenase [Massilia sp. WG5]KLU38521.1 3-hydroxyacyl-CoA dehydrogenase [Massilia sp. WF1]
MAQALDKGSVVAVVGSGAMGAGIAQVAAGAGHLVRLYDTRPGAVEKAIADIGKAWDKLVAKGRMGADEASLARERLRPAASQTELKDAALVVEAIVEDLDLKRALFAGLEDIVDPACILATNTSSISVTAIAAQLKHPERLVGMHFFNPVPLMALVEVVEGVATEKAVADTVYATAEAWGKSPVHAKSTPGFIVNRVARPYYAEALRLLQEQAADAATLDAVMRDCGGFRMGPFELMDLIGHDVNFSVTQSVFKAYFHDPRFTPSVLQQELVNAGFLGRKSGRGFYRYGDNAAAPVPQAEPAVEPPPTVRVTRTHKDPEPLFEALHEVLSARLAEAGVSITHPGLLDGVDAIEAPAFHVRGAAIFMTDGRSATQRALDDNCPNTVLFDLLLDPARATRIALAKADQCSEEAWRAAVGMFQAAGFTVTHLDDVPGMAVMRTVAMLANEAADAVNQGVCSARAVDIAMQKGVNYPRGPLAWADAVGLCHIVRVLHNLADTYGEDRYRVSPLLRRKLAANPRGARFHAV